MNREPGAVANGVHVSGERSHMPRPTYRTPDVAASAARVYRKGSLCSDAACVEVSMGPDILVRNSAAPETAIAFSQEEWRVFVAAIRMGEFDIE